MSSRDRATDHRELVLVGADDARVSADVASALGTEAFVVLACPCRLVPLRWRVLRPGLIILDADSDPREFVRICRRIRSASPVPIVAVGASADESLVAQALDTGADDYVRRPFAHGELSARLEAILRRTLTQGDDGAIVAGPLVIDEPRHLVLVDGRELSLSVTEFALLLLLARQRDHIVTREDMLASVWGVECGEAYHLLHVAMSRLRRKIHAEHGLDIGIQTVTGLGYRLTVGRADAARS